jgi:hypothetical protein
VLNPLVAFYDIHGKTREVLFLYFVPDTTRDYYICMWSLKEVSKINIILIPVVNVKSGRKCELKFVVAYFV